MASYESLVRSIRTSPYFSQFRRAYSNIVQNLDEDALVREVLSMHAKRRVRKLTAQTILADVQYELVEANAQNQAYRSRATTIYVRLYMAHGEIEELNDRFWRLVSSTYGRHMVSVGLKSQASKLDFYGHLVPKVYERLAHLSKSLTVCQTIIDDMDAAGYSLLRSSKVLSTTAGDR